ncbi:hypothetical protein HB912_12330 [Listeria aquatica]|uniref:Uncharacterized protein n=1 Tax=Listeria aquatica TaxID=1494960 RepID=A0A841ZTD4_9LIST|nr:hypothetical protein [Listeria aquatica]MBC1522435.1 hypothetical protein [Listeria aquatica]
MTKEIDQFLASVRSLRKLGFHERGRLSKAEETQEKFVFHSIRCIAYFPIQTLVREMQQDKRFLEGLLNLLSAIHQGIDRLTPQQFETLFPIEKLYSGESEKEKAYFYTQKMIHELIGEGDEPIKREAAAFLWNYQNNEVRRFVTRTMIIGKLFYQSKEVSSSVQDFAKLMGGVSIAN